MTTRLKDIPALLRDSANLATVMQSVRESLQTLLGYRGDPADAAMTRRGSVGAVSVSLADGAPTGALV